MIKVQPRKSGKEDHHLIDRNEINEEGLNRLKQP